MPLSIIFDLGHLNRRSLSCLCRLVYLLPKVIIAYFRIVSCAVK